MTQKIYHFDFFLIKISQLLKEKLCIMCFQDFIIQSNFWLEIKIQKLYHRKFFFAIINFFIIYFKIAILHSFYLNINFKLKINQIYVLPKTWKKFLKNLWPPWTGVPESYVSFFYVVLLILLSFLNLQIFFFVSLYN